MKLLLNGMIAGGGFGKWLREMEEDVILPSDITEAVTKANELGEDLEVELTTPGGSVMDAGTMVAELAKLKGTSKVTISGLVASAGTVLASVFDEVSMSDFSYFLIHYPRQQFSGTLRPQELQEISSALTAITTQSIDIYEKKTGLARDVIEEYMAKESMFGASQAKELGFVDKIIGTTTQSVDDKLNLNPQLVMKKSDDKYDQLYKEFSQGDFEMSKEQLEEAKVVEPVVEPTAEPTVEPVVEDETKEDEEPETKVAEPVAEPAAEPEPTLADVLTAITELTKAFTQSVAKPEPAKVVEPVQPIQTVEVKIAKPEVPAQSMVATSTYNALGFDTKHYDI